MTGARLKRQVEFLFDIVKERSSTDELVFLCPIPGCGDETGNRSVNLKTGATNCWRCNRGFRNFVHLCNKLGFVIEDGSHADPDISETEKLATELDATVYGTVVPIISTCELPAGFTFIRDDPNSVWVELITEMAVSKHLTFNDLVDAGVGFTTTGPWEPYAIFPVTEWSKVVYYQGRKYNAEKGETTKRFPNRRETPLGAKYWVYNIDKARKDKARVVIVVESILNVLSLEKKLAQQGINDTVPVCVFKHSVSKPQLAKLLALKFVEELCLMWDADSVDLAWQTAQGLTNQRVVTVAELYPQEGNKTQDANDDVDYAWERFLVRRRAGSPVNVLDKLVEGL